MKNVVSQGMKRIIDDKGLKQSAVAAKSGFTSQQISDMLLGRKIIRAEFLPRIAVALGVDITDIYAAGETMTGPPEREGMTEVGKPEPPPA